MLVADDEAVASRAEPAGGANGSEIDAEVLLVRSLLVSAVVLLFVPLVPVPVAEVLSAVR